MSELNREIVEHRSGGIIPPAFIANGRKWRLRLHEKGGKILEVPVHHKADKPLDASIQSARIEGDKRGPAS